MKEESVFMNGRSCIKNMFCPTKLIGKEKVMRYDIHFVFVDLATAYNCVSTCKLFDI
jgi:hypothetical protein